MGVFECCWTQRTDDNAINAIAARNDILEAIDNVLVALTSSRYLQYS